MTDGTVIVLFGNVRYVHRRAQNKRPKLWYSVFNGLMGL
jgi:hypothetical protein